MVSRSAMVTVFVGMGANSSFFLSPQDTNDGHFALPCLPVAIFPLIFIYPQARGQLHARLYVLRSSLAHDA